jgi:hypothetical protein
VTPKGEVKNYLTHEKVFGYIQNNIIVDVIKTSEFKERGMYLNIALKFAAIVSIDTWV